MEKKIALLKEKLAKIADLEGAATLLNWDQQVYMPPGGAQTRADQMATIQGMAHELKTSEEYGILLEDLAGQLGELDYDSDEAGIIRHNWRDYQKDTLIPNDRMMAYFQLNAIAYETWKQARESDDFTIFLPQLEKLVELQQEFISYLGDGYENPYDVLVDYYESGMTAGLIKSIFDPVKTELIALVQAIGEAEPIDDSPLYGNFSGEGLIAMSRVMAEQMGYSFEHGRLDLTTHPFSGGPSYQDTRITTFIDEEVPMFTLLASIHEAGHAIHSQQCSPTLYRTRADRYSMGIAESQSQIYEMVMGTTKAFWEYFYPQMQQTFPHLADTPLDAFYRALHVVKPGLIRIMADQVTYPLHIMLRFDLENDIYNNRVAVKDLPDAWNAKMEEYLGLTPPSDADGVLQDVHWTMMMGYFPTYLLGAMFTVQLWDKALIDLPNTEEQIARGNFAPVTAWLGEKVHRHGAKFTLPEIAMRALGEEFSSAPYMAYLKKKFGGIYRL